MVRLACVLLLCSVAGSAHAVDYYMWGVGARIGTNILPARYPTQFPKEVTQLTEACEADTSQTCGFEKVWHDFTFGVEGVYYVNRHGRVGMIGGIGVGKKYFDAHVLLKYDYVGQSGPLDLLIGGGLGAGTTTFRGLADEQLRVPNFPFRIETAALIRDVSRGYQVTLYGQYNLPSNHFFKDAAGEEMDVGSGIYLTAGIEFAVLFGDFLPPAKRKKAPPAKKPAPPPPVPVEEPVEVDDR